jgi:hypothetical protein
MMPVPALVKAFTFAHICKAMMPVTPGVVTMLLFWAAQDGDTMFLRTVCIYRSPHGVATQKTKITSSHRRQNLRSHHDILIL